MSGHQLLIAGLAFALSFSTCRAADLDEIVTRSAATLKADWAAHDDYSYIEKDEVLKDGRWTGKTSQVVYIDGSDYYLPVGADPLQLKAEVARRSAETSDQRKQRIAKYLQQRDANQALIRDLPDAFEFSLTGDDVVDGHKAWVLQATAKRRTGPLTLAAKVLSGMKGTAWIDQNGFHAIQVQCNVVTPVPVYGILAKVLPGTHVEFAMMPVTDSVWLVSELKMDLRVSKFFFFHSTQVTRSSYTNYRPNAEVLAELTAN